MVESNTSTTQSYNQELIQWGGGQKGHAPPFQLWQSALKWDQIFHTDANCAGRCTREICPLVSVPPSSDFLDQPLI